jgi:AcrR family transcriptional regulator
MGRPPLCRNRILDAAERIVAGRGAGSLTFEELSQESGVTRGGITYHFPTKDALLRALLDRDMAKWAEAEAALRPDDAPPAAADLIASIRAASRRDRQHHRFAAGMLGAATLDPSLLDGCREMHRQQFSKARWSEPELKRLVLELASHGLFWMEMLQMYELPGPARKRLLALLEKLAREWS